MQVLIGGISIMIAVMIFMAAALIAFAVIGCCTYYALRWILGVFGLIHLLDN